MVPPGVPALAGGQGPARHRLDPFGHTRVRRVEQELIAEYTGTIDDLLGQLSSETYQRAVEIARLRPSSAATKTLSSPTSSITAPSCRTC